MMPALLAGLILAAYPPYQGVTERMRQVQQAKELAQKIELGGTVDEVERQVRRLGLPSVSYARCAAGKCQKSFDELSATRRTASWQVADHRLLVVFCGTAKAWRAASVDLTPSTNVDGLGKDRRAVLLKQDAEQARACEAEPPPPPPQ
jgi:hypothetical protein